MKKKSYVGVIITRNGLICVASALKDIKKEVKL